MKYLKTQKQLSEASENLNISDVRSSIVNRQREIESLKKELENILIKTKHFSRTEIGEKGFKLKIDSLKSQILKLEHRNKLDKIKIGDKDW
jgi:hypothetical protein